MLGFMQNYVVIIAYNWCQEGSRTLIFTQKLYKIKKFKKLLFHKTAKSNFNKEFGKY